MSRRLWHKKIAIPESVAGFYAQLINEGCCHYLSCYFSEEGLNCVCMCTRVTHVFSIRFKILSDNVTRSKRRRALSALSKHCSSEGGVSCGKKQQARKERLWLLKWSKGFLGKTASFNHLDTHHLAIRATHITSSVCSTSICWPSPIRGRALWIWQKKAV